MFTMYKDILLVLCLAAIFALVMWRCNSDFGIFPASAEGYNYEECVKDKTGMTTAEFYSRFEYVPYCGS